MNTAPDPQPARRAVRPDPVRGNASASRRRRRGPIPAEVAVLAAATLIGTLVAALLASCIVDTTPTASAARAGGHHVRGTETGEVVAALTAVAGRGEMSTSPARARSGTELPAPQRDIHSGQAGGGGVEGAAEPYSAGLAVTTVGQLGSADESCTATVIPSQSGRIAVTAAHCVYADRRFITDAGTPSRDGWIDGLVFYPGRDGDNAPYGRWPVVKAWVDSAYIDQPTPDLDVAFIELADQDGITAQHALGAQGIAFQALHPATHTTVDPTPTTVEPTPAPGSSRRSGDPEPTRSATPPNGTTANPPRTTNPGTGSTATAGTGVTVLGFPVNPPFKGTELYRCTAPDTVGFPDGYADFAALHCDMTGGSSGGPWLTRFDPATGAGVVAAVTSFSTDDHPDMLGAAPLGSTAARLLDAADTDAADTEAPDTDAGTSTPPPTPGSGEHADD